MYLTIYRFIYGARAHMVGRSDGRSDAWLRAHFRQIYILEADGQKAETFHKYHPDHASARTKVY